MNTTSQVGVGIVGLGAAGVVTGAGGGVAYWALHPKAVDTTHAGSIARAEDAWAADPAFARLENPFTAAATDRAAEVGAKLARAETAGSIGRWGFFGGIAIASVGAGVLGYAQRSAA